MDEAMAGIQQTNIDNYRTNVDLYATPNYEEEDSILINSKESNDKRKCEETKRRLFVGSHSNRFNFLNSLQIASVIYIFSSELNDLTEDPGVCVRQ